MVPGFRYFSGTPGTAVSSVHSDTWVDYGLGRRAGAVRAAETSRASSAAQHGPKVARRGREPKNTSRNTPKDDGRHRREVLTRRRPSHLDHLAPAAGLMKGDALFSRSCRPNSHLGLVRDVAKWTGNSDPRSTVATLPAGQASPTSVVAGRTAQFAFQHQGRIQRTFTSRLSAARPRHEIPRREFQTSLEAGRDTYGVTS